MANSVEIICEDCGEVMLVDPGDKINYRLIDDLNDEQAFKFLCAVCNKKEDPNQIRIITSLGKVDLIVECHICGKTNCKKYHAHFNENFYYICDDCIDQQDYEA